MAPVRTLVTAEQLPELARDRRVELVRGEVVEMSPVGRKHGKIVLRLGSWMVPFIEERKLGAFGTEVGFILARNPDTVRAPDLFFLSAKWSGGPNDDGYYEGAPDLAIEVVSPDERASAMQEKVREYLVAGTLLVLQADPQTKTVTAYRPSGEARVYSGDDVVSCDPALPGFSFRVSDLFRLD